MSIEINNVNTKVNLPQHTNVIIFKRQPLPQDKVEISSASKPASNGKKIAIGLGIVGIIIGSILLHKKFGKNKIKEGFTSIKEIDKKFAKLENNLPEVQKKFQDVFLRNDLTEEQTREILKGYKEVELLGLTSTKEEYVKALFEQAKKNYQIYNPSMKVVFKDPAQLHGEAYGCCGSSNKEIIITSFGLQQSNSKLFETIHHELRHAKQNEFMYHYNPDGNLKTTIYEECLADYFNDFNKQSEFTRKIAKKFGYFNINKKEIQKEIDKTINVSEIIEKNYGKADSSKIPDDFKDKVKRMDFELGTTIHYPDQLVEKDAFRIGKIMRDLIFGS